MRKYLLYTAFAIFIGGFIADSVLFGQSDKPFSGKPLTRMLQSSAVINCFSDESANTGYYRNWNTKPDVALDSSALKKQSAGGGYRITLEGDQAMVFDEFMKESYQFILYGRRTDGVILIRPKGVGVFLARLGKSQIKGR
jgi:hypothetical protein